MLSNKVVILISAILMLVIALDGRVYNRPPVRAGINSLSTQAPIKIKKDSELLMAFAHKNGRWHLSKPFAAPVRQSRIEELLRTNNATSRRYPVSELNDPTLFDNAVVIEIGSHTYHIGQLEPVSQLRYVLANDTVYLQPDTVIPLLSAGQRAFIDLALTNKVEQVAVNKKTVSDLESWSNLETLGIISPERIDGEPVAQISLTSSNRKKMHLNLHSLNGVAILMSDEKRYGYVLSPEQAQALQLLDYL